MIDFRMCRQCNLGCYQPAEVKDDKTVVKASVKCELADDDLLLMNSDPPKECPYALEHKLLTQDVPMEFANHMSGFRRKLETEF